MVKATDSAKNTAAVPGLIEARKPSCTSLSVEARIRLYEIVEFIGRWSMIDVFVVALVKIGGMASVDLGPAVWAMAGLVVLVVYEGTALDEWSIWQSLDRTGRG